MCEQCTVVVGSLFFSGLCARVSSTSKPIDLTQAQSSLKDRLPAITVSASATCRKCCMTSTLSIQLYQPATADCCVTVATIAVHGTTTVRTTAQMMGCADTSLHCCHCNCLSTCPSFLPPIPVPNQPPTQQRQPHCNLLPMLAGCHGCAHPRHRVCTATYQSVSAEVLHFTSKENDALPQQQAEWITCHVCCPGCKDWLPICLNPWTIPALAVEASRPADDCCSHPRGCTAAAASAEARRPTAAAAVACLLAWSLQGRHLQTSDASKYTGAAYAMATGPAPYTKTSARSRPPSFAAGVMQHDSAANKPR